MAFQLAGQTLKKGSSFSAGNTLFPSNWLELSTPEERKNIGISETADTPTAEDTQEPIRLAGGGAPTSSADNADTSLEPSKPESGPGSDAEWNTFLEALGAGFDGSEPKEIAGNRFTVSETGLTYNKPSRGSALSYGLNRVEKPIEAPIKTDLLPTAPAAPAAPSKPAAATPPPGGGSSITYTPPAAYEAPKDNTDWGSSEPEETPPPKPPEPKAPEPKAPEEPQAPAPTPPAPTPPAPVSAPETLAINRFVDPNTGRHLYTSNVEEGNLAGLSSEGQAFELFKNSGQTGTADVYRLFNPSTGNHFYTASADEKNVAAGAGYTVEGTVGAAYTTPTENSTAVDRYFQAATGQHFYTSNAQEAQNLASLGFQREGVAFYTPNSAQQYWEAANSSRGYD
jgi:hypothetical protein